MALLRDIHGPRHGPACTGSPSVSAVAPTAAAPRIDDLRPEVLLAAASQATGLDDYGDLGFLEGMGILLKDLRTKAGLSERGIAAQFQNMVRILSNRLGFQRDLTLHPEILDAPIEKPIMVFGLPRTGTTKLQRTIAADPCAQRLEMWRLLFPAPLPGSEGVKPDPRIAIAEQAEAALTKQFPELMARHPMETHEPDEEWFLLEMTFESRMPSLSFRLPNHRAWLERRSQRNAYAYLRNILQYLQWQDGGARGRPWILKSPCHFGELATVLETFPDVTIVHCHRDPRTVIPSFASLMEYARLMYCDHVDPIELGEDFNTFWGQQADRNLATRREMGEARIVDVYYEDILDRSETVIAEVYAHAGRTITPEALRAFAEYTARRPEGHFGKYQYTMEYYGLSNEKIDAAFANYLHRFPRVRSA